MYIAIEWTSAAFHAYRLSAEGEVAAEKSSACGVNSIEPGGFEAALRLEITDWLADAEAVLLSGMVTSRNGWVETPYAQTPASAADIAKLAVLRRIEGLPPLFFLPGVAQQSPLPDVMRGEEIGVLGMGIADGLVVLPGAHSKWISLAGGGIDGVTTYLTGELAGFLKTGSIVSRLIPADVEENPSAFELGVGNSARQPFGQLFSARSLPLFERLEPAQIPSYIDGLLIGAEVREQMRSGRPVHIRRHPLAAKYLQAIQLLGHSAALADADAPAGFHQVKTTLPTG